LRVQKGFSKKMVEESRKRRKKHRNMKGQRCGAKKSEKKKRGRGKRRLREKKGEKKKPVIFGPGFWGSGGETEMGKTKCEGTSTYWRKPGAPSTGAYSTKSAKKERQERGKPGPR